MKNFSFINIVGLVVGMAACMLIILLFHEELTVFIRKYLPA
jgi:hypothetical protein